MNETTPTRRRGRRVAGVLAGGLALSLLPFAAPASAEPRNIESACPPEEVPDFGFTDVPSTNTHHDAINCVAYYGITLGAGDGTTYEPGEPVQRDQMASFIVRLMEYAIESNGGTPALPTFDVGNDENLFPCDVSVGTGASINPHYASINILARAEIEIDIDDDEELETVTVVQGGPGGLDSDCYGPGLPVSREQMASFIHRAEIFLGAEIEGPHPNAFSDDETSIHEDNINAIASEGITAGLDEFTYNPGGDVQRDQMASFLARKLDYLVDSDAVTVAPPNPFVQVEVNDDPAEVEEADADASVSVTVSSNVEFSEVEIAPGTDSENCTVDTATQSVSPANDEVTFDVDLSTTDLATEGEEETCVLVFTITFPTSASGATSAVSEEVEITVTEAPAAS